MTKHIPQSTLDELAAQEQQLLTQIGAATGTLEQRTTQLEQQGIFEQYNAIYAAYGRIAAKHVEALKRGIFLLWYADAEPCAFTGLRNLDAAATHKILNTFNRRLKLDITDYEMQWMLSYYNSWDYLFASYIDYPHFLEWMNTKATESLPDSIDRENMAQRGQMGAYWNSLDRFGGGEK